MSVAEDSALFDLLPDGIARVDPAADSLWPCNAAMRALLHAGDEAVAFEQLLPQAGMRERLRRGDAVDVRRDDGCWRLRLLSTPQAQWLLAQDVSAAQALLAQAQAGARARALGSIADAIVHELGNHLNSAIAIAEQLRPQAAAADRDYLGKLLQGTRQGSDLLRTLARLLRRDPHTVVGIDLDAMVSQVAALSTRALAQRGCELRWQPGAGLRVRGVAEDLELALLQALLRVPPEHAGSSALTIDTAVTEQSLAGGRSRRCGTVRVGAPWPWSAAEGFDAGLLQSALLLRRSGGDLRVGRDAEGGWLALELPLEAAS